MKALKKYGNLAILLGIVAVSCSACSKAGITQPDFKSAYAKWQFNSPSNYTVVQELTCNCPDAGQPMLVTVQADTVASVMRISDSTMVLNSGCVTIDSLFSLIQNPKGATIVASYSSVYGYPEDVQVNPALLPSSGGVRYVTSNLHAR